MRLSYQPEDNLLRLTLDRASDEAGRRVDLQGYVDVGEGGRLVGVEAIASGDVDLASALGDWLADPVAGDYVSVSKDAAYIELSAPEEDDVRENVRATPASLRAELDLSGNLIALSIPRRGAGYEISYPSGNR